MGLLSKKSRYLNIKSGHDCCVFVLDTCKSTKTYLTELEFKILEMRYMNGRFVESTSDYGTNGYIQGCDRTLIPCSLHVSYNMKHLTYYRNNRKGSKDSAGGPSIRCGCAAVCFATECKASILNAYHYTLLS